MVQWTVQLDFGILHLASAIKLSPTTRSPSVPWLFIPMSECFQQCLPLTCLDRPTFASGAADNIKKWKLPSGDFLHNLSGHNAIINTLALNEDGVLVSGADNGSLYFWDYNTGYNFYTNQTIVQPGSLESEAGIFASSNFRSCVLS